MIDWPVVQSSSYKTSLENLEEKIYQNFLDLEARDFPTVQTRLLEVSQDRLTSIIAKTSRLKTSSESELKLLDKLSTQENYYVFHPLLSEFSVYFALDVSTGAFVALLIRWDNEMNTDLYSILQPALDAHRRENARNHP